MPATKIAIDPGYGFAEFEFGDTTSKPIDLYAASEKYDDIVAKNTTCRDTDEGETNWPEVWDAVRAYLAEFGVPNTLSLAGVIQVVNEIRKAIAALQKKDLPPASSGGPG